MYDTLLKLLTSIVLFHLHLWLLVTHQWNINFILPFFWKENNDNLQAVPKLSTSVVTGTRHERTVTICENVMDSSDLPRKAHSLWKNVLPVRHLIHRHILPGVDKVCICRQYSGYHRLGNGYWMLCLRWMRGNFYILRTKPYFVHPLSSSHENRIHEYDFPMHIQETRF